jgi:glycosyltransferase involved in cell wall biosynthesis
MKYLVAVDDCFLDRPGGMGRVAWDILMLMRDRGHQVAMVAARPHPDGAAPSVTVEHGVRILRYSRPSLSAWHPLRGHRTVTAAEQAARAYFADERWDVVHMHSPFTGAAILRALGTGPRYIYSMHSPVVMEQRINWARQGAVGRLKMTLGLGALKRIERQVLRRCDAIHTLSEFCATKVEQFHGLGERVAVVPYWRRQELRREHTKAEARRRLGWPVDETILLSVRTLGPRYGLDTAIEAVAPLARARQCLFVIGGDGPLRAELRQLVYRLHVSERVRFTGRLDEAQLRLAYQAADLFLLPTAALECFGLIIVEALSFGCPVLSTDAGAIPELMRPILPTFIVPAGNVNALRAQLERFLAGDLVPPPPEALVAHVERYFAKATIAAQLTSLLERTQTTAPAATRLAS